MPILLLSLGPVLLGDLGAQLGHRELPRLEGAGPHLEALPHVVEPLGEGQRARLLSFVVMVGGVRTRV